MRRQLCVIALATVAVAGTARSQTPSQDLPAVIAGSLPVYPEIAIYAKVVGTVRLLVTTDGAAVGDVKTLETIPLLEHAALEAVRTWRFAPHAATQFETAVGFKRRDAPSTCAGGPDFNRWWRAELPRQVEVLADPPPSCYWVQPDPEPGVLVTYDIAGGLRSDRGHPVDGAWVSVRKLGSWGSDGESAVADADGRFALQEGQPGWYRLDAHASGHFPRGWAVFVDRSSLTPGLALELRAAAPAEIPPPIVVRGVGIPSYEAARDRTGEVMLQLDAGDRITVAAGDPALAAVALEHFRSWDYSRTRPEALAITYRFHRGRGPARVVADLPRTIDVWR